MPSPVLAAASATLFADLVAVAKERTSTSPLTPPAEPFAARPGAKDGAHDSEGEVEADAEPELAEDLFAAVAAAADTAETVVPSSSSPASPTSSSIVTKHSHVRKVERPHRAPRERTLSNSPGVVFHFTTARSDAANAGCEILQYPHSKLPPLAAHVVPFAALHAAAAGGTETSEDTSPASPASTAYDNGSDSDLDGSQQEVPRYGDRADALRAPPVSRPSSLAGPGAVPRVRRPAVRKTPAHEPSLALARASAFYPKNPKSDRGKRGQRERRHSARAGPRHRTLLTACSPFSGRGRRWAAGRAQFRAASRPTRATKSALPAAPRRHPTGAMAGTASSCATRAAFASPSTVCGV